jgi:putative inorganic carbon (HCO3(-)) transporter
MSTPGPVIPVIERPNRARRLALPWPHSAAEHSWRPPSLAQDWGWLALLAMSPLILFPAPAHSPALLIVPIGLWAWRMGKRAQYTQTPADWPLVLTALMVLVSLYATFDIGYSVGKVGGVVLGIGMFYAVLSAVIGSPLRLRLAVDGYLLLGGSVALLALLATDWPARARLASAVIAHLPQRVITLPGAAEGLHFNEVAGTLLWIVPLGLAFTIAAWQQPTPKPPAAHNQSTFLLVSVQFAAIAATALASLVLLLTQSRGGLLGLAAGVLLMLALGGRRSRWLSLAGGIVAVAIGGLWVYHVGPAHTIEIVVGTSEQVADVTSTTSLEGRFELWSRAIYAIQDFPFTGMGMNTFRKVVPVLYPLFTIGADDINAAHAHNHWLQVAVDLGLPGLIAHLATWFITVGMLLQVWRQAIDPWLRVIAIGILGSLSAYFVYGLFDTVALGARPGLLLWILLALATLVWKQMREPFVLTSDQSNAATD